MEINLPFYLTRIHVFSKSDCKELKFHEENGVILSTDIHNEFHNKYGREDNTKAELLEFADSKGINLREKLKDLPDHIDFPGHQFDIILDTKEDVKTETLPLS